MGGAADGGISLDGFRAKGLWPVLFHHFNHVTSKNASLNEIKLGAGRSFFRIRPVSFPGCSKGSFFMKKQVVEFGRNGVARPALSQLLSLVGVHRVRVS